MKKILTQRFEFYLLYLLTIHIAALLIFTLFRLVLFISTDYQFPEEIQNDLATQSIAFIKGLWFDNVIACYILVLPLVVLWITGIFNYTSQSVSYTHLTLPTTERV